MIKLFSVVVLIFSAVSCSSNYKITGDYPTPLVAAIPVVVELVFADDFRNYIYTDDLQRGNELTIALGEAQVGLFESISTAIFNGAEGAPTLKITPQVDSFQYAAPRQTRSQIYEVWIKYRVAVEEPDGLVIADWIITGYGKTPTAFMKGQGDAINAATVVALRDIGTQLAIGFKRQPDIALWLGSTLEAPSI